MAPLDEIDRELRRTARSALTIFLPDESSLAALQDWPIAAQLLHWTMRGHPVRLAITQPQIQKLSPAEKLAVRDFVLQHNVGLVTADAPAFANGASALAMIDSEGGYRYVWATRETEPRFPGPIWGRPISRAVGRGSMSVAVEIAKIELSRLLPPPGAQLLQIGSELDCDLATFGARASKIIIQLLAKCGSWPGGGVVQASYRDSYVTSPLVARLLIDAMSQVFAQSGAQDAALTVETRQPRSNDQRGGQPWQIGHDWRDTADQKAVIELYGKQRDIRVTVLHKNVPHGRYLTINFGDGSHATIVLDQGFGAWAPPRNVSVRYDFGADHATQAKRLATINAVLQRRGTGKTYLIATSVQ
jgi:hypothetical protein